jgi:hypothetical protein
MPEYGLVIEENFGSVLIVIALKRANNVKLNLIQKGLPLWIILLIYTGSILGIPEFVLETLGDCGLVL